MAQVGTKVRRTKQQSVSGPGKYIATSRQKQSSDECYETSRVDEVVWVR